MVKLNLVLLFALMGSALYLVHLQHQNRLLFTQISRENRIQVELQRDRRQLVIEQQNLVAPDRVAHKAQTDLHMYVPSIFAVQRVPYDVVTLSNFEDQIPANVILLEQGGTHE